MISLKGTRNDLTHLGMMDALDLLANSIGGGVGIELFRSGQDSAWLIGRMFWLMRLAGSWEF